jgi:hypothetical protein
MPGRHLFRVAGKQIRWLYVRLRGTADGWSFLGDRILIDERLKGRRRLEVEIHEYLHQSNPTHSEEAVTEQARDLSRILWVLGYRAER